MYEVHVMDCTGEWGLYHITSKKKAYILKEELENNPDVDGVRVIPAKKTSCLDVPSTYNIWYM